MTTYALLRPGEEPLHVEADEYRRGNARELFLHNDTASGPIGDFPADTAIVEFGRVV